MIKSKIYKNKKELISDLVGAKDVVLDVGFWGQGIGINDQNWVHNLLLNRAENVYGLDLDFDLERLVNKSNYQKASAENFDFETKFDIIFCGDVIEHLSNPGLFLESAGRNLKKSGRLIITTPNCFNLYNLAEKLSKDEPTVNKDHTCYFNRKTLEQLLKKNGWTAEKIAYLYSLEVDYKESLKKKFLNMLYYLLSKFTHKYATILVVVAKKAVLDK